MTPKVSEIRQAVCRYYNISEQDLLFGRGRKAAAPSRQIAMYLATQMTALSGKQIATALGRSDHSTVVHARKAVIARLAKEPELIGELASIRAYIAAIVESRDIYRAPIASAQIEA